MIDTFTNFFIGVLLVCSIESCSTPETSAEKLFSENQEYRFLKAYLRLMVLLDEPINNNLEIE